MICESFPGANSMNYGYELDVLRYTLLVQTKVYKNSNHIMVWTHPYVYHTIGFWIPLNHIMVKNIPFYFL